MSTTGDFKAHRRGGSLLGGLWELWSQKRRRDRVRALSRVRFRLTREGVHYIGILLFVFVGAMLRDINLLILLAGAMIGLLVLQWRFSSRTLLGLSAQRRLPRNTSAGLETDIVVRINNRKRWLGAWLVLVQEPVVQLQPDAGKLSEQGCAVIDEVRPRASNESRYSLTFHRRGRFRIGPSTLSTRFPLGLGRGARTLDNASELTVYPALGELKPAAETLFQQELQGHSRIAPQAGLHEAEFFGLRPWETGDSRRWIHWRTTARLGQLSVRQFERQQRNQLCVLLDLHAAGPQRKMEPDAHCEQAISFVATLACATARHGGNRLAVAVAGDDAFASANVQSAILVEDLLERLAVVRSSPNPSLGDALAGIRLPLLSNPFLLVISTRSDQSIRLRKDFDVQGTKLLSRLQIKWVDASQGGLQEYFSWT